VAATSAGLQVVRGSTDADSVQLRALSPGRYALVHAAIAAIGIAAAYASGHVAAVLTATVALGVAAHAAGQRRLHRRSATARREVEARYRTLVEQLPLITYIDTPYSADEAAAFISPQIETLLGYTQEEWFSYSDFYVDRLHPQDRERVRSLQRAARETGAPLEIEYRFRAKDGSYVWLSDSYTVVVDDRGAPWYTQGFALDVTARKQAEEDREALLAQAQLQNERLLELDRVKDEFIALVSHELRTPLTSIRGYLELVTDDADSAGLPPEYKGWLTVIDRNAERLLSLVEDLLISAQSHSGSLMLAVGEVDVGTVLRECALACSPNAATRGITLECATEPGLVVPGDATRLAQVVDNLASNALKFTPAGGRVELIASRYDDDVVRIEVADTGTGIPADEQERLFERFFRTERAQSDAVTGAGLGLSIAKAIIEAHRGQITCRSVEGQGTTFVVDLPS
jgi:PAS domain S-box-containing protein